MEKTMTMLTFLILVFAPNMAMGQADLMPQADERPALPFPAGIIAESLCGVTDELQDVELYNGTLGVTKAYVDEHQATTVQLQWLDETTMAERLPGHALGNIAGARWCTGTLIGHNLILTAGHCFDVQRGTTGWITPFAIHGGELAFVQPAQLAKLQIANFLYQINGETLVLREAVSFPVVELVEYRRLDLDYALVKLGPGADGKLPGQIFPVAETLTRVPIEDELLAVIQHPQGWPKKIEAGRVLKVVGSFAWYNDIH